MNVAVSLPSARTDDVHWFSARLQQPTAGGWCLSDGRQAQAALSCLIELQVGDQVLAVNTAGGNYIVQLLERASEQPVTLGSLDKPLQLQGERVQVLARNELSLGSGGDCDISTARGTLALQAAQMTTTVMGSWIQSARTSVCRFGDWAVNVRQLMRLHGKRQQLTAEKELKVDAEIIHMG